MGLPPLKAFIAREGHGPGGVGGSYRNPKSANFPPKNSGTKFHVKFYNRPQLAAEERGSRRERPAPSKVGAANHPNHEQYSPAAECLERIN